MVFGKINNDSNFTICLLKRFTNLDCLFCGMTRAFMCFTRFDFIAGFNYNKLVIFYYPILMFIVLQDMFVILLKKETSFVEYILGV